ncbi:CPBP family intramembrane glutamic endopeptidase [Nocardioides sp. Bht2]|uniref:CPBP family intramembrane glutamic endopeptidase n=1 Tax=Nocardioides sp. Bht2 TaxID=3392297 RepID=UPI0039B58486
MVTPYPAAEAVPSPEPVAGSGLAYHQLHRAGPRGGWRAPLGVLFLGSTWLTAGLILSLLIGVGHLVYLFATGVDDPMERFEDVLTLEKLTPLGLAYLALSLAVLIPLAFAAQRMLHGLRPGTLSSVAPRLRWRYLFACTGLAVVALLATLLVSALLPAETAGEVGSTLAPFTTTSLWFLVVIAFLVPIQAAGEEYAFRGYLTQAFGGLFPQRREQLATWVAVLGPAFIFALMHGLSQDWPIFFDRFAFGVVAGILVVRTGGLEAAIAMHVLNNWFAFTLALVFGEMDTVLTPTGGSWWSIPVTLTQSLVYLALALWLAKRMGLESRSGRGVLVARGGRV